MVNFKVKKQKGINKVKQKVNQKVSQKVVVNLGDTKPKRRRAPAKPKPKPKEQQLKPPIGLPSQVVMNQPAQNNSLAELLMKNLALSQNVRQEQKLVPEVPPPPKPNELEKPKREILAEKAEARRDKQQPSITDYFKPAFDTKKEDKAEQEALDRFENAKRLTALYRQVEAPVIVPAIVGLKAEIKKDPNVESLALNKTFLQPSSLSGEKKAQYKSVLDLIFRNRAPLVVGEQEPNEFTTPRYEVGKRVEVKPVEPLLTFQDITTEATAPEPKQPEAELEVGVSSLVQPVDQGPPLAQQLNQPQEAKVEAEEPPDDGASHQLGADQSETLFSRQPEEIQVGTQQGELPLSFAFEEPTPTLPTQVAEINVEAQAKEPLSGESIEELNLGAEVKAEAPTPSRRAFTGSELLPPIEGVSTVLNQPIIETPLKQLFQPITEPSLVAGIEETKKKKSQPSQERVELLRLMTVNDIKVPTQWFNEEGVVIAGPAPNWLLKEELLKNGIEQAREIKVQAQRKSRTAGKKEA